MKFRSNLFALVLATFAALSVTSVRASDMGPGTVTHVETTVGRLLPKPAPRLTEVMVATDTYNSTTTQSLAACWSDGAMIAGEKLGVLDAYSANKLFQQGCGTAEIGGAWLDRFHVPALRLAFGGQADIGKLRLAGGFVEYLPVANTLGEWRPTIEVAGRVSYRLTEKFSLGLRAELKSIHDWREMPYDVADVFGNKALIGLNVNYSRGGTGFGAFIAPNRTSLNLSYGF